MSPHNARRLLSLGCSTTTPDIGAARALPLGAWITRAERVTSGDAVDATARGVAFPRDRAAIATTAVERFAGTPYQWGGVSPWGADCSGLTQTTFWLHGIQLPRDAWQQAESGDDAGADVSNWRNADLLFFSDRTDRRITHVGISLGDSRMVHLALGRGGYAVERLDSDDPYVRALMSRFVVARRVGI
jgi:cell wall-associated NlpC family hydrolase